MKKPNIVLIMTDEMRGDCMGVAGHPDIKTPYLDTLATNGVLYENAYSSCPSCVPARANLLTGLSQKHTGRVGYQDGVERIPYSSLPQTTGKCCPTTVYAENQEPTKAAFTFQ